MAPLKCCVGGCDSTSATHRLYCFPKNDHLRNLWMSFLVPRNSLLLGLSKDQLVNRRVCQKHFDKQQFDVEGKRLRHSYPCLFTEEEIARGEPLPSPGDVVSEHNYCKIQDNEDVNDKILVIGTAASAANEHNYAAKKNECDIGKIVTVGTTDEPPSSSQSKIITILDIHVTEPKVQLQPPGEVEDSCAVSHKITAVPLPPQPKTVKEFSFKKLRSRQRQFVKKVKNDTTESLGLSSSERLEKAQNFLENRKLLENFHHLTKQAQTFLIMQLRECRRNKMARRFTLEEKLMALLMLKQSPKEYKLLQSMFALPSKRTLNRMSEKISVGPGLNPQIFSYIENKTKKWNAKEKLCSIVFDEVALTPHLTYDEKNDQILGFVDEAEDRKLNFCDHALVFMLRGVCSSWRQTVAYYLCEGTIPAPTLKDILKKIVSQVALAGLSPLGLVCDQGSTFRSAIKKLREDTLRLRNREGLRDDGSINIAGHDLSVFFDPPHLLKGLRNNFLNKDIIWEGKKASWKDIEFIYDLDSKLGHTRALPKLTEYHVNPHKIKKMKVSVATQVFSARTAAMLKYTNALNVFHTGNEGTIAVTAEVVEFFDRLFDSVNGYPGGGGSKGKLRKAVKPNSEHVAFWRDAIKKLKSIKFEDCGSKAAVKAGNPRLVRVPSLEGWITTLESFIRLTRVLFEKYEVDFFYPRNINQDPLENYFGRIRALNYRNINPDAHTFSCAFKSLLLTNILGPHSKFANCEEDNGELLVDAGFLFEDKNSNKENEPPKASSPLCSSQEHPPIQSSGSFNKQEVIMEKVKVQCSSYTAGYISRKLSKKIKCMRCLNTYTSSYMEGIHNYIKEREYKNLKNNNLVYPTPKVIRLYREISQCIHSYLDKNGHKPLLYKNIRNMILKNFELNWLGCANHKSQIEALFIKSVTKLQIHNWCSIINRILKGGIASKHVSTMQHSQILALRKYSTYILRKKKINK